MATGMNAIAAAFAKHSASKGLTVEQAWPDGFVHDAQGMPIGRVVPTHTEGWTDQTGSRPIYHPPENGQTVLALVPYKGKSGATGQWLPDPARYPAPAGYPHPGDYTIALDGDLPAPKRGQRYGGLSAGQWYWLSKRKEALWNIGRAVGDTNANGIGAVANPEGLAEALLTPRERQYFAEDRWHADKGLRALTDVVGGVVIASVAAVATAGVVTSLAAPGALAGAAPAPVAAGGGGAGAISLGGAAAAAGAAKPILSMVTPLLGSKPSSSSVPTAPAMPALPMPLPAGPGLGGEVVIGGVRMPLVVALGAAGLLLVLLLGR